MVRVAAVLVLWESVQIFLLTVNFRSIVAAGKAAANSSLAVNPLVFTSIVLHIPGQDATYSLHFQT